MASRDVTIRYVGDSKLAERAARNVREANQKLERQLGGVHARLTKGFKSVGSSFASTGKTILKAGAVAAAGGIAALGVGLVGAFKAAQESLKVSRQTEQVIKTMGASSWTSSKQISLFSERLAQLTGVDDEIIQQGANLILTFKSIRNEAGKGNDIFDRTVTLANDMSVALGQDMKSSSIQLGKALNDPIRGLTSLRRVGVSFTDAQEKQIKALTESGDLLGAQRLILKEVEAQFGGTAKAVATPWDRLKVTLGNLQERIGTALFPILDRAVAFFNAYLPEAIEVSKKAFEGIKDAFKRTADAFRPIISAIVDFFKANPKAGFAALAAVLGGVVLASIIAVGVAIAAALTPFVLVTAAVAALAAGVVYAYTRWGWFRDAVDAVVSWFSDTAIPAVKDFARSVSETFRGIAEAVTHVMNVIRGIVTVFVEVVTALWHRFGETIVTFVRERWAAIQQIIQGVLGVIRGIIKFFIALINGDWGKAWNAIKDIFRNIWQIILGFLKAILANIKLVLVLAWEAIKAAAGNAWRWVRERIAAAWEGIKTKVRNAVDWVKDKLADRWDKIKRAAANVWRSIRDTAGDIWEGIKNKVRSGVNGVINIINTLIGGVNWVLRKLKIPEIPKIGTLGSGSGTGRRGTSGGAAGYRAAARASGGLVPVGPGFMTDGPMAVVGEGNPMYPEYVVPTDPKYRGRAKGLATKLIGQLGGLPGMQFGGLLGAFKSGVSWAKDQLSDLGGTLLRKALTIGFAPFNLAAKTALSAAPNPFGIRDIAQKLRESVWDWVKGADSALPKEPPIPKAGLTRMGAGVEKWRDIALKALRYTGQSISWINDLLTQMAHESGGNQFAINNWDINAQNGDPSRGLMQTIGATFNAYAGELAGRGIFDPFANIVAAIRYTVSRYGSLGAWRQRNFTGYAAGGIVPGPIGRAQLALVHGGEEVLTRAQRRRLSINGGSQGRDIVIHTHLMLDGREVAEVVNRHNARNNGRNSVRVR